MRKAVEWRILVSALPNIGVTASPIHLSLLSEFRQKFYGIGPSRPIPNLDGRFMDDPRLTSLTRYIP